MTVVSLIIVRFSIRNRRWKAQKLSFVPIWIDMTLWERPAPLLGRIRYSKNRCVWLPFRLSINRINWRVPTKCSTTYPLSSMSSPPCMVYPNDLSGRAASRSDAGIRCAAGWLMPLDEPRKMYTTPSPSNGAPTAKSVQKRNIWIRKNFLIQVLTIYSFTILISKNHKQVYYFPSISFK